MLKIGKADLIISTSVILNLFFVLFHIYKHGKFIKSSYEIQRLEKSKAELDSESRELRFKLYELYDLKDILSFAEEENMTPVNLNQIQVVNK